MLTNPFFLFTIACLLISFPRFAVSLTYDSFTLNHRNHSHNHDLVKGYKNRNISLNAVVLSTNQVKYDHAKSILVECGFDNIERKIPIDYKSPIIDIQYKIFRNKSDPWEVLELDKYKKTFSNRLTFIEIIENFRDEPANISTNLDWKFFFEDDIDAHLNLVPNYPAAITHAMKLAKSDGILMLGACGPTLRGQSFEHDFVQSTKMYAMCTHAWGLAKWKTGPFLHRIDELSIKLRDGLNGIYMDQMLYHFGKYHENIFLVGSNISISRGNDGLFWQNRDMFKSEING
eukprot:gene15865-21507_t